MNENELKKRVFLSLPMSGRDISNQIDELEEMSEVVKKIILKDDELEFVANLMDHDDLYELTNTLHDCTDFRNESVGYLGFALILLASCDLAVFSKNWQYARGCKIEHEVCKLYNIPIHYITDEEIKDMYDKIRKED